MGDTPDEAIAAWNTRAPKEGGVDDIALNDERWGSGDIEPILMNPYSQKDLAIAKWRQEGYSKGQIMVMTACNFPESIDAILREGKPEAKGE
jgi:hypothetical protein